MTTSVFSRTRRRVPSALAISLPLALLGVLGVHVSGLADTDSTVCQSTMDQDSDASLMDFTKPESTEDFNAEFPQLKISQSKNNNIMFEPSTGITTIEKDILDPQRIIFKNGGKASVTFLTEGAGYSSLFGYIRAKDIAHYIEYEYDKDGNVTEERLRDCDGNGIPDFHEDLYRLRSKKNAYDQGNPRPIGKLLSDGTRDGACRYIDKDACDRSSDKNIFECQTFEYFEGNDVCTPSDSVLKSSDGTIEYGKLCSLAISNNGGELNNVPNLLEPPGPKNSYKGIGRIIYSQADYRGYGANTNDAAQYFYTSSNDSSEYNYSKRNENRHMLWKMEDICLDGKKRDTRTTDWCSDRAVVSGNIGNTTVKTVRVDLMENFEPGDEIIFFLIVYGSTNYTCVAPNWKTGRCDKTVNSSYNVYFTKQILNSSSTASNSAEWSNGYTTLMTGKGKKIIVDALRSNSFGADGWLLQSSIDTADAFVPGLNLNSNLYGQNSAYVRATDGSLSKKTTGKETDKFPRFPHALSANFSWAPNYWILGFEDQSVNGTGDWDYEDIAFIIKQQGGGTIRSDVVTGDANASSASSGVSTNSICTGKDCDSYSITNVLLKIKDDQHRKCVGTGANYSCSKNSSECSNSKITYELATDCEVWDDAAEKYVINNTPKWRTIESSNCITDITDTNYKLCSVNLSLEGYTGSRLCWRARFETEDETKCRPLLEALDIRYDMMRPGTYSRSSPTSMANTIFYGSWELLRPTENSCTDQQKYDLNSSTCYPPSTHYQDSTDDYTARGHFVFQDLYQFNSEGTSLNCKDDCTDGSQCALPSSCWNWDAGDRLANEINKNPGTPQDPRRLLFTTTAGGELIQLLDGENNISMPVYSRIYELILKLGLQPDNTYDSNYNFNRDGQTSPNNDSPFLINWLLGWEHPGDSRAKIPTERRAWPMGAFEFSTPAIVGPPTQNPKLPVLERANYNNNFMKQYYSTDKDRPATAYMGASDGFLHAFDAGIYRYDKRLHPNDAAKKGAFIDKNDKIAKGTGSEIFGFIPRKQLSRLANNYLRQSPAALSESSPSVSDIDLGYNKEWTRASSSSSWKGAMTALAMSSGKNSPVVFALDVTDIEYGSSDEKSYQPRVLWELDLESDKIFKTGDNTQTLAEYAATKYSIFSPNDNSGNSIALNTNASRHSPTIARLNFVKNATDMSDGDNARWVAIFSSDYGDGASVGAVHIIDFATGLPVMTSQSTSKVVTELDEGFISTNLKDLRGLYLLEKGEGVAGEIPAVDINDDGVAEVLYVPTTQGRIYKINTATNQSCVFVDLHEDLKEYASEVKEFTSLEDPSKTLKYNEDLKAEHFQYQNLYSSMAVTVESSYKVHLYVGTGNNPDNSSDTADQIQGIHYWLVGITDASVRDARPGDKGRCATPFSAITGTPLIQGQSVWGGVAASSSGSIAVTSAAGTSADACHLRSGEGSGYIYQFDEPTKLNIPTTDSGASPEKFSSQATDSPIISAPIFVNGQVVAVSAAAKVETLGDGNFNQAATFESVINLLNWQRVPSGKINP